MASYLHSDDLKEVSEDQNVVSLMGNLRLTFTFVDNYEPPLYLFPELISQDNHISEDNSKRIIHDAVETALSREQSSWKLINMSLLDRHHEDSNPSEAMDIGSSQESPTLFSMIASGRLREVGLFPSILQKEMFSSSGVIQELVNLSKTLNLVEDEMSVIMTNHFLNLLAWRYICQLNSNSKKVEKRSFSEDSSVEADKTIRRRRLEDQEAGIETNDILEKSSNDEISSSTSDSNLLPLESNDISMLLPSKDPWEFYNTRGVFIAEGEEHMEDRMELLKTLKKIYSKTPWPSYKSIGIQTDMKYGSRIINTTHPCVDITLTENGTFTLNNLGIDFLKNAAHKDNSSVPLTSMSDQSSCYWVINFKAGLNSNLASSSNKDIEDKSQALNTVFIENIPWNTVNFGRDEGIVRHADGVSFINYGLSQWTSKTDCLSAHHFSLICIPESEENQQLLSIDDLDSETKKLSSQTSKTNEEEKKPGCYLWLINYAFNGTCINGKKWIFGNPHRLDSSADIFAVDDLCISVYPSQKKTSNM